MIFVLLSYVGIFLVLGVTKQNKFSPAVLFSVMWAFFSCAAVVLLHGRYDFNYKGLMWISVAVFLFAIPQILLFSSQRTTKRMKKNQVKSNVQIPWLFLKTVLLLSWIPVISTVITRGISLSTLFNFSELMSSTHSLAVEHYQNADGGSIVQQLLNSFCYIAPLCCGYSLPHARTRKKMVLCFSCFAPAVLSLILVSTKLLLISSVLFFCIAYYVSYLNLRKSFINIKKKYFCWLACIVVVFFLLIYLSFVLRIGSFSKETHGIILEKIGVYAAGHMQGFDTWFVQWENDKLGLGTHTFLSLSNILGILEKKQGVYDMLPNSCTNVYTQFRALLEDWGIVQSLVWMLHAGLFTSLLCMWIMRNNERNVCSQITLSTLLIWLFYFMISVWAYTTNVVAMLAFAVFIYVACTPRKRKLVTA